VFLRILENLPTFRSHKTRAAELGFYYPHFACNLITESGARALIGYNGNSFHVATNNERGQRIGAGLQGTREQAWQRHAWGGYATVAERLNFSHRASDALRQASAPVPIS
jgi:hypothetical protein